MKEALKLALEALERLALPKNADDIFRRAITAIKEALAQPEQEPVAWRAPNWGHGDDEWVYRDFDDPVLIADGKPSPNNEPLYATPPQRTWVGLTDEKVEAIAEEFGVGGWISDFARAIEAELKEKNDC